RLYEAEAVAQKRLLEARHELEIAQATMAALGNPENEGWDFPVRAPISGVVQARHFTPGQRVEAGDALFEIVDPSRVWLRLKVPARHASAAAGATGAIFTVEGSERVYRTRRLVSVGAAIDATSRTLPVILSVENRDLSLKIGHFVRAQLLVGGEVSGVLVPNGAIQRDDGQPVAYVQVAGETFQRRPLVLGASDGARTLVERGVREGEHVVTRGAYDVYLASLSTSEIGDHGHPH
ncbi:MAG: efflux RND transporter periplasmic adaptor subunit, partial [Thermoanaerobaculia bacterium]|nr:efflux RND transporter periplasmic adaptor subunit [Thermoanaerobaculia bacterium]